MRNHLNNLLRIVTLNVTFLLILHVMADAQQVISSNGNYFSGNSGSVTYTIGETFVETYSSANQIVTQGFNQYFLFITPVNESVGTDFAISAYPNPTNEKLTLRIIRENKTDLQYNIYDLTGNLLISGGVINDETIIGFEELPAGEYLLRIVNLNVELKTFKIVKTN